MDGWKGEWKESSSCEWCGGFSSHPEESLWFASVKQMPWCAWYVPGLAADGGLAQVFSLELASFQVHGR